MLEVEVFGEEHAFSAKHAFDAKLAREAPPPEEVRRLCALAAAAAGVKNGHLAIEYVDEQRIAQLNAEHRGKPGPTDVLSFPIDGAVPINSAAAVDGATVHGGVTAHGDATARGDLAQRGGTAPRDSTAERDGIERELGDVVICPTQTSDLREAIVHGVLHLVGFDHETDNGEMLALQAQLLAEEGR